MNLPDTIKTKDHFQQASALIEVYLQKATAGGGFDSLTEEEADELAVLSKAVAEYEKREKISF